MTVPSHFQLQQMEATMLRACVASACSENPCIAAVRYHLNVPGNQLRGRACLDAGARLGLPENTSIYLASVCELLHNASLIHDDLIDWAPERRGQASVWARFGDGIAICTGDLLLSSAYELAAETFPPEATRDVLRLVHRRTRDVVLGEAAELIAAAKISIGTAEYEALARGKSASLLSLSLELPLLAAGHVRLLPAAQEFAAYFAVAYQIADDVNDLEQDTRTNSLNFVTVLAAAHDRTVGDARALAIERAIDLLEDAFALVSSLPDGCGTMLVEHARALQNDLLDCSPNTIGITLA